MQLRIPHRLKESLEACDFYPCLHTAADAYVDLFRQSGTPFFPNYTDHGPKHVETILATANELMSESSWPSFSSYDAGALVLAAILHDCALHIDSHGFVSLVTKAFDAESTSFDNQTWRDLWTDFVFEAHRFDDRRLLAIFGDTQPIAAPPLDPDCISGRDCLLIGEFLRRYHGRLAHETAIFGFPSGNGRQFLLSGIDTDLCAITGFIARSHSMELRQTFDYLEEICLGNRRAYRDIHAVYLMSLLRIADFLDLGPTRAPQSVFSVKRIKSPVSTIEWKANLSVKDMNMLHDDPEALVVDALPQDVNTFLRLRKWLSDFQQELDISWAVLGEVYGRYDGLKQLGFRVRRVRSNLEKPETLSKTVDYIPHKASIETSHGELLKLLVGPLYGNRPEFAIREMIQNATDAVRERLELIRQAGKEAFPDGEGIEDIKVQLSSDRKGNCQIVFTDKGIGMSVAVVLEYFLRVGASFRKCEVWQRQFEDEFGHATVLRSGRFGVGVLAAFLLGPEIIVRTRHATEKTGNGLSFKASVTAENIEIRRVKCPVGTEITIPLSADVFNGLLEAPEYWDWYCWGHPRVRRMHGSEGEELHQEYTVPTGGVEPHDYWRRFATGEYENIWWNYFEGPALAVNGIRIQTPWGNEDAGDLMEGYAHFPIPNVSVSDPDGRFPLDLQRTRYPFEQYPFEQELFRDMMRDFLAHILVCGPDKSASCEKGWSWYYERPYPANPVERGIDTPIPVWFSVDGEFSLIHHWHLDASGTKGLVALPSALEGIDFDQYILRAKTGATRIGTTNQYTIASDVVASTLGMLDVSSRSQKIPKDCIAGIRFLIPTRERSHLARMFDLAHFEEEWSKGEYILFASPACPEELLDYEELVEDIETTYGAQEMALGELHLDDASRNRRQLPLEKAWKDILHSPSIPIDPAIRKKKLNRAFAELSDYIKPWMDIKKSGRLVHRLKSLL